MATEIHLFGGAYDLEVEQREPDGRLEVVAAYADGPLRSHAVNGVTFIAPAEEVTPEMIAEREGVTIDALRAMIREEFNGVMCAEDERRTEERWGR